MIVEIPQGFKLAVVKFIGETEFAAGEWIGVAFERPIGKVSYKQEYTLKGACIQVLSDINGLCIT